MKTIIPSLINSIISLCCNTKNQPTPPEECDPYRDDPFAIANIKSTIDIEINSEDKNQNNQ